MNKPTIVFAAFTFAGILILFSAAGLEVTKANWLYMPQEPITDLPQLTIQSPGNNSIYLDNVDINITVTKPSSWIPEGMKPFGCIRAITYWIDEQEFDFYRAQNQVPYDELEPYSNFSTFISGVLSEGMHTVKVTVDAATIYWQWPTPPPGVHNGASAATIKEYPLSISETVTFNMATKPKILNLFIENKTYNQNSLPLNFTIDKPVSWIGYSLDNQANVTITGNTTLSFQAGLHNLTIYTRDPAGKIGASNTVEFLIQPNLPRPTQSTTASPTSSPIKLVPTDDPPDLTLFYIYGGIIGLTIIAMTIDGIIYLKRRRKIVFYDRSR